MEPSTIFAIVAGVIILFGRIASRVAERSRNTVEDSAQNHDTQRTLYDEEGSLVSQSTIEPEEAFAGSILAQILAEKRLNAGNNEKRTSTYTQRLKPAELTSNTGATSKPAKTDKIKDSTRFSGPSSEANTEVGNTTNLEVIEDFDLKKAVIYSEILKPKFDE